MKKGKKINFNLSKIIIGFIITLLIIVALLIGFVGYTKFTDSFTKEYNEFAYRTALTASTMIDADNISSYLENNKDNDEYKTTKKKLNLLCETQGVASIIVMIPDEEDTNYTMLFECINRTEHMMDQNGTERKAPPKDKYQEHYRELYEGNVERQTIVRDEILNNANADINSMIPLKDSTGEVIAIITVQQFMEELSNNRANYIIWVGVITLFVITITIIIAHKFIHKNIGNPIKEVTDEANRFANEETKRKNNLDTRFSRVKEINSLSSSIEKMEEDTINYIENLTDATKEKERISTELQLASSIQESVLPNVFPAFPNRSEFDIYASMYPAKEVGGDFYDFFLVDDDHLAIVIADVAGKGIPAALFMMNTKIIISEHTSIDNGPAEILKLVNNRICSNNKNDMFVTVWLGILEISTGKLVTANAGHEDPILYQKDKGFQIQKSKHGTAVGVMKDYQYIDEEIKLECEDKLFLYTDGIPEARNCDNQMYGLEKMINSLNKVSDKDVKSILTSVKEDVDNFVGNATQFDDLTMLCVEIKNK